MVAPAVVAGVAQGIGSFLSGRSRAGEARVARRAVDSKMEEAIRYAKRMNKKQGGQATGLDLQKLRDEAISAGFNPLTVLAATGGGGYQRVLSPFGDVASMMVRRAELVGQMSGSVIETAGYLGEAISSGVGSYFGQRNIDSANALDAARTAAIAGVGSQGTASTAGRYQPFGGAPVVVQDGGLLPSDWWQNAKEQAGSWVRGIVDRDLFSRFGSFGNVTVTPEGPDAESILSGIWIEATNKAKQKGYIAPDAEREWYDRMIDIGAEGYRVGGWAVDYLQRMGALSRW